MSKELILDIMAIPLTRGLYALVDGTNYEQLSKHKWYAKNHHGYWYAVRSIISRSGKPKMIYMHREILNAPKGAETDHINHNGLDNRMSNIRLCSKNQNHYNQLPHKHSTSKYKGVSWHKRDKKWEGRIRYHTQLIYLGYFDNEIDAARAYDKAAKELFGEFAYLNFGGAVREANR